MAPKSSILCLICLSLVGCIKDTNLDAKLENRVVVEFVLTDDSVQNLYLSLTRGSEDAAAPNVQEAEIKLIDLTLGFETSQFIKEDGPLWTLDYSGIPGHLYRLEVKVDGYDTVWAEQGVPEKPELIRAGRGNEMPPPKFVGYGAFYYADFVPGYLLIRGEKINQKTGEHSVVDELCTDYPGVVTINATGRFYDGNPKWRTGELWEEGWEYHDTPVAGKDGAWSYLFPNLIGKDLYEDFLLLSRVEDDHAGLDRLYDFEMGKGFSISGSFHSGYAFWDSVNHVFYGKDHSPIEYKEYLVYYSLSPDYGEFLKDVYQFKKTHGGDNLSSIYLRNNIHTNIAGGLGVFGSMVSGMVQFDGFNQIP